MTVGQKIQQKRKEQGLSQEALGERLGVSRQAIYKWETDAALPEVEKLLALSRLFSVSVGWLLGAEEEGSSEELTEAQLHMVETLASRWQQAQPAPPKRRWRLAAACVAAVALAAVVIVLAGRTSRLQTAYDRLNDSIDRISLNVAAQISSITSQVESVLQQAGTLTVAQGAAIHSGDLAADTVTFSLHATPKSYVEGMGVRFVATWGDQSAQVEGTPDAGLSFTGQLTIPLTDEQVTLSAILITGLRQDTQILTSYWDLRANTFPYHLMDALPIFFIIEDNVLTEGQIDVTLMSIGDSLYEGRGGLPMAQVVEQRLGLFQDGQLVRWLEPVEAPPDADPGWTAFRNPTPLPLDPESVYCLALVVTDNYGRTTIIPDWSAVVCRDGVWGYDDGENSLEQSWFHYPE